ncbi:uncharacterized protein RHIMIDRAFT_78315 [Rhizopus microsporus ATCC 52813]|uniref:Uncharacterized protein n=1 Tax=Rhizopus microsporus ATCC 52813 TaxID=1340429 RepID=A0A2G4SIB8_RHIZD|nr:uncharacterized protein RHIMIDRAFT_78315 [Rhizopus microsporus ATCC 52813]PHZ08136.1 hypothetical protein RHIMIDRAFT_78315 [Rhizopus microsporus ATCC 52813]
MCCTSANKTDDLDNIEFAKNINKGKHYANHASHRKSFKRGQKLAAINYIRRREISVKPVLLLERLMGFGERDYIKP